ncbi:MAG: hypothetical protein EOP85_00705 [Verrucomicrobiaceae bacterium]|nr:MAG: hypothetical protein EOP85_00705 [Verrucomicrobiaceae bacterium]
MINHQALRHWRAIEALDSRAIRRTIENLRDARRFPHPPQYVEAEEKALCFWWTERRQSRAHIREILNGGAL